MPRLIIWRTTFFDITISSEVEVGLVYDKDVFQSGCKFNGLGIRLKRSNCDKKYDKKDKTLLHEFNI